MSELKLEAGNRYGTREGKEAFVAAVFLKSPYTHQPTHPVVVFHPSGQVTRHTLAGMVFDSNCTNDLDLIAPWVDPPTPLEVCRELLEQWKNTSDDYLMPWAVRLRKRADAAIAAHSK
jgi:hypothetical protein